MTHIKRRQSISPIWRRKSEPNLLILKEEEVLSMLLRELIKKERIKRGWTLEQVGEKINRSHNAVWHYEMGSRTIDSETMELFSQLFGYEWREAVLQIPLHKTVRELYQSLPDEQAYQSLGKFYYSWRAEDVSRREQKLCQDINERLGLYGYQLKDKSLAGEYNDITGYMNMEVILMTKKEENFDKKQDVLIQNPQDLGYVGLCSEGAFHYKTMIEGRMQEVFIVRKEGDKYKLKTFVPLTETETTYGYVEECFYNLIPYGVLKLTPKEQDIVMEYFGEA